MKLKRISCALAVLLAGLFCGCDVQYNGLTGEVVTNLTQLSAPYNVTYDDETKTLSWAQVDNTSGYYLQINDGTPIGKLQNNYYKVYFDEDCTFTASIKACGNGIVYSDSDWFVAAENFTYTVDKNDDLDSSDDSSSSDDLDSSGDSSSSDSSDSGTGGEVEIPNYEEDYQGTGLGKSINYITANSYESMSGGVSIFDTDKLYRQAVKNEVIGTQVSTVTSEENLDSFMYQWGIGSNQKVGAGVTVKKVSANLNMGSSSSYEKKKASESLQLYYNVRQMITGKRLEIANYKDVGLFADMLTDGFLADAQKVNSGTMGAKEFIDKYGTHVMMAGYYGGAFDASYSVIAHDTEVNRTWMASAEAGLSASFAGIGGSVQSGVNISALTTDSAKDKITNFNVSALGGASKSFGSMESFLNDYDAWASSVTEDTYAIVDVPDGSLYCVWEYLDDSYQNAKNILNNYMVEQCDERYNALKEKFGQFFNAEDLEYDSATKTLTVNLGIYQESGAAGVFDAAYYQDNTLTLYPSTNYQDVQTVKIKGAYGTNNANGQEITTLINNMSFHFDESWRKDVRVILENVGLSQNYNKPILDFSAVSSAYTVTVELVGENKLDGLIADTAEKQAPIVGNKVVLSGSGNLEVIGATGKKGTDGTGANGVDGIAAIVAENLTVDMSGSLVAIGGDGGNGGSGHNGRSYGYQGDRKATYHGGDGGNGGDGGDGAHAIVANYFELTANVTIVLQSGNGGNGGDGGKGGNGSSTGEWNHRGGNGGDGGDGGDGGNSHSVYYATETFIEGEIVVMTSTYGIGGSFGNKGSAGCGKTAPQYFPWTANTVAEWWGSNGSNGSNGADGIVL